jgi:hypothetical protein
MPKISTLPCLLFYSLLAGDSLHGRVDFTPSLELRRIFDSMVVEPPWHIIQVELEEIPGIIKLKAEEWAESEIGGVWPKSRPGTAWDLPEKQTESKKTRGMAPVVEQVRPSSIPSTTKTKQKQLKSEK